MSQPAVGSPLDSSSRLGGNEPVVLGRYAIWPALARGGMASVHLGRMVGAQGFTRVVAVKRLHPQYASEPEFVEMFFDEARLVARLRHPNIVPTLDLVSEGEEQCLVMEYVHGETLGKLLREASIQGKSLPLDVIGAIFSGVLRGLHAAHEATNSHGEPLNLVHRDVSPQNVMVGLDGTTRVLDFGVAKAAMNVQHTRDGQIKGKFAYMSPEQVRGMADRRADIYAAAVTLWESLTLARLFSGSNEAQLLARVMENQIEKPSVYRPDLSESVDALVLKGLAADVDERFQTAEEMAAEVERVFGVAPPKRVGEWVGLLCAELHTTRAAALAAVENADVSQISRSLPPTALGVADGPTSNPSVISSISSVSSAAGAPTAITLIEANTRDRKPYFFAVAVGFAVLAAVWWMVKRPGELASAPTGQPEPPKATHVEAAAAPPIAVPAATSATVAVDAPAASAEAAEPASTKTGRRSGGRAWGAASPKPSAPTTATTTAKPAANCASPFFVDGNGIKRMKPECL